MASIPESLKNSPLFRGIEDEDLLTLLRCVSTGEREYEKDAPVLLAGSRVSKIGLVLSGSVIVIQDDFWGNRTILEKMEAGDVFAEVFPFAGTTSIPVSVIAREKTSVLFLDHKKLITLCSSACAFHTRLIGNLLALMAEKNILLTRKIGHISRRSTREKLISYLSAQALKAESHSFTIPFNRQELADYLSVDRSAMSSELGKLRDEGILAFKKNSFTLHDGQNNNRRQGISPQ